MEAPKKADQFSNGQGNRNRGWLIPAPKVGRSVLGLFCFGVGHKGTIATQAHQGGGMETDNEGYAITNPPVCEKHGIKKDGWIVCGFFEWACSLCSEEFRKKHEIGL